MAKAFKAKKTGKPKVIASLADLTRDPMNARVHGERNIGMLQKSLEQYGAARSIVVDEDGGIIAGHGVVEAAGDVGITKVRPVETDGNEIIAVVRRGLTKQQKKELAIADNRTGELSEWDPKILAALSEEVNLAQFWSDGELKELLGMNVESQDEGPEPQIDKAAELQKKWKTERGQIWKIGKHRLICGDCTNLEDCDRLMLRACALTVTSPPYGVGIDYGEAFKDTLKNVRSLLALLPSVLAHVTVSGGYACINFGDIISARDSLGTEEVCEYPMAVEYWPVFWAAGWMLHSRRIWAKPHARVAAPWCASSNRAASDWEHLWTWKLPGQGLNERRAPSYLGVWDTSLEAGVDVGKQVHGAGMAVAVASHCIHIYSNTGDVVFEPMAGTGTTFVAASQLGRICYGMEIEPKYVAVCLQRMADMGLTPKLAKQ